MYFIFYFFFHEDIDFNMINLCNKDEYIKVLQSE
ncbi:hypothetical protein PFNF54_01323 [Plasmodium falciparum NF54]|uniref:Uncharacterized protein n=1 Tax=Plasmodium falciparum (isolate NF54) TaxID=5843 RepID=W7K875_PLAFO|nr:hypothetical protein PFNF54_01323 [Plasmodium falciparum NF54]